MDGNFYLKCTNDAITKLNSSGAATFMLENKYLVNMDSYDINWGLFQLILLRYVLDYFRITLVHTQGREKAQCHLILTFVMISIVGGASAT